MMITLFRKRATCKIVNYFKLPIYFWWGGAKLLGEGVAERGKGVGARGLGQRACSKGGGVREGQGGVESICLTSLTHAKCSTRSTLCWKILNISDSTKLFAL